MYLRITQIFVIIYMITGCVSSKAVPEKVYFSSVDRIQFAPAVRIGAICANGNEIVGSGFIVDSQHVITAKHLSECNPIGYMLLVKVNNEDTVIAAVLDKALENSDVMRLRSLEPLNTDRSVISRRSVMVGEEICSIGGGGNFVIGWVKKCGFIAEHSDRVMITSIPVVPGNSGSPVFNKRGEVVGIVSAGVWDSHQEKLAIIIPVKAWISLLE